MRFASTGNANGLPSVPKTGSDSKKGWAHLFLAFKVKKGRKFCFQSWPVDELEFLVHAFVLSVLVLGNTSSGSTNEQLL